MKFFLIEIVKSIREVIIANLKEIGRWLTEKQ
ncbi:hypothetical protein SAMN05428642_101351 [Flaviramulus basaltis]|uniref:Uncharacterized protein n=1 Tax=Flaviramulus basaltis TaxID=369401 RepID=A0A1K2IB62_9FLAO|nr:hypothetical protein SAMN05428642_101351 [Flaviramulus basaltis]